MRDRRHDPSVYRYDSGADPGCGARPDFVLVGVPRPDGVELWASTELSYAELEAQIAYRPYLPEELFGRIDYPSPEPESTTITLRAGLARFVIVQAPTYRQALAALMDHPGWQPPGGGGPLALGPPPRSDPPVTGPDQRA